MRTNTRANSNSLDGKNHFCLPRSYPSSCFPFFLLLPSIPIYLICFSTSTSIEVCKSLFYHFCLSNLSVCLSSYLSVMISAYSSEKWENSRLIMSLQFSSVAQLCLTLWDLTDCSTSGFPVHHQLPELAQTHVHQVSDAIQPSHPLSSPSPPAFNLPQHQGLFQ